MTAKPKGSKNSEGPGRLFYGAMAALVVAGAAALWWMAAGGDEGGTAAPQPVPVSSAEADADAGVAVGPEDAPVTVMEFVDFQCPHCAQFNGFTGKLIRQNYVHEQGLVRWIFYDFPLGSFPNSIPAALAARCAGAQGEFTSMHDMLLARQSEWGREGNPTRTFVGFAEELGLDTGDFRSCVEDRRHLEEIRASQKYGEQLGVNATPSLFVNGERLSGVPSYQQLEQLVRRAAAEADTASSGAGGGG